MRELNTMTLAAKLRKAWKPEGKSQKSKIFCEGFGNRHVRNSLRDSRYYGPFYLFGFCVLTFGFPRYKA